MLNGILEIGRILSGSSIEDYLKNKVIYKDAPSEAKIVRVIFEPSEKKIRLVPEEFDKSKLEKYLWVGNAKGNVPQTRLTSDNLMKIFTQSIFNAYRQLDEGELKNILNEIIETFTCEKEGRRVIDLSLIEDLDESLKEKWKNVEKIGKGEDITNILNEYLMKKLSISKKILSSLLFTVYYKEKSLVEYEEYKRMLYKEFVEEAFSDTEVGVCHGCGKETQITKDFSKFELKFFITDKINFASGIDKEGFYKNFALCDECFTAFGTGEKFLKNNLKTRFTRIPYPCYIIPDFYDTDTIPSSRILAERAKDTIHTAESLNSADKWNEYREQLEERIETEAFALNFVFVEEQNAAVKIKKLIMDVPPSRIKEIIHKRNIAREKFKELFPEKGEYFRVSELDFDRIFYLFPVRKDLPGNILEVYDSILSKKPLNERKIIKDFLEVVTIYYYDKYNGYYHTKPKNENSVFWKVIDHIFTSNQFIMYARELNILQGGGGSMNYEDLDVIGTDLRKYVETLELDEQKTGLFLLGVLLSEVARAQVNKGDGKKVILEKLNYYGMPQSKIKIFSNELFEKLKQYKVLNAHTELVYALAKKYLDISDKNWTLSPQENVYWIKSGYAYQTMKTITGSQRTTELNEEN